MAKPMQESNTVTVVNPIEIHWCIMENPPVDKVSVKWKKEGRKREELILQNNGPYFFNI